MKGQRHIEIIELYAKHKLFNVLDKEKFQSFIKRNLRSAILLISYSNEEIERTMEWLKKNANFKWTLESVGKFIDEDLFALEEKQKEEEMKRLGFWLCKFNYWHSKFEQCGHSEAFK